jgi:hypothetical protein
LSHSLSAFDASRAANRRVALAGKLSVSGRAFVPTSGRQPNV